MIERECNVRACKRGTTAKRSQVVIQDRKSVWVVRQVVILDGVNDMNRYSNVVDEA
jgi:hypothetical protein